MIQFFSKEISNFAEFISDNRVPPVNLFVIPNSDSLVTEEGEEYNEDEAENYAELMLERWTKKGTR